MSQILRWHVSFLWIYYIDWNWKYSSILTCDIYYDWYKKRIKQILLIANWNKKDYGKLFCRLAQNTMFCAIVFHHCIIYYYDVSFCKSSFFKSLSDERLERMIIYNLNKITIVFRFCKNYCKNDKKNVCNSLVFKHPWNIENETRHN